MFMYQIQNEHINCIDKLMFIRDLVSYALFYRNTLLIYYLQITNKSMLII